MDRLVERGLSCLTVVDVSGAALARARGRLGSRGDCVRWVEEDVTGEWKIDPVDIWHDRAVFHFLTDRGDRLRYVSRVVQNVNRGGHAIVATFAPGGPSQCSGLPVARYSSESLASELGAQFTLIDAVRETHITPAGSAQPFTYAVFRVGPRSR